ncbi:hypothetical protein HQ520_03675 [bacterium]|nr:hypothetical protein [bacterium]
MKSYRRQFQDILEWNPPERPLWVPRLDIWYRANRSRGTLPAEVQDMGLHEIEAMLGMGRSARDARIYRLEHDSSIREKSERQGDMVLEWIETPAGTVQSSWYWPDQNREAGIARLHQERPIKSEADFEVLRYLWEHSSWVADYEAFEAYDREVGEAGYPMVGIGFTPIHTIMISYMGYEAFYDALYERPEPILELLEVMESKYREMWEIVAASPAPLVLHCQNITSSMTPRPIFERFFMPYCQAFNARMHKAGIRVATHTDADLTGLIELVRDCDFDVSDCFACAPLVTTTFDEAWEAWRDKIVIWGGLPSTMLEPEYPLEEFRRYARELHETMKGRAGFIWAVSDNVMPGAELDRLKWVRDLLFA